MQEAHRGKSLSTELVGMVSGLTPEVMHVETRVLPDIFVLPTSKENSKEQYPLGEHPRWTTVLPDTRTTHFDIRLAKEMLHGKLKEGDHSLPVEVRFKHKQYDHTKESKENIEPRSEDRVLLSPHNRATSGRSLFKILAGQQQNSDPNESSGKNQTSSATTEKENKMSPFRFGLQQLFTPRLPVALPAYPQMITYAPQYSAGSLLYPTRAPLLPLYTTTALLPAAAHAARPAPEISPTRMPQQHPAASSIVKAVETTTVAASPDECPGDCVDVFAALMCGQVDEEARCVLSNQRCCVGGTEQVTKFLKRHGSLTKKKKKHSKKYQKNIQHNKESITAATDNGAENANTVKIAVEEGGHLKNTRDVQKILIHSTSTTSSAFSKGDTTKEPAIIQLSSGNGVLQVIGSKDQLWTTRYPNIPKYVTIVTTTRRPHKPQREHATRRMDLYPDDRRLGSTVIYKAENSSPNKGAEITHEELEELARNTKSSKHQKNDCGDVDEVDKDDSEPGRDGIHESVPILAAELDIIKSGAHEVKVRQPYKRKHQKMEAQKCNIRKQAHGNHINDNGKNQDLHDEGVTVDTVYDTELDPSSGQAERTEEQLPACPGNCVLPLFSLFCQPESKTAHVCTAPGRVCCVGASTGPSSVEKSEPASETTENPAQAEAEETINADESHDQECNGR
ncbi:hypothetical protein BIW11_09860 [Tropilaelaps mercedesae]|uniref:Protein masquerade clip-domain domain-containing protein n=1 Tax=Tropilaelaps mercedesae TaxID=418985 RepID=A0A1V9XI86_9ACAR|nr:hypothetical protein BIW11_09860 [Tropilaelaps mercedesae]